MIKISHLNIINASNLQSDDNYIYQKLSNLISFLDTLSLTKIKKINNIIIISTLSTFFANS